MRKEKDFIATFGRDEGAKFHIKEMPAEQAFDWGVRALLAMAKSGVDIPEDIATQGMAGVAAVMVRTVGGLEFMTVNALKKELLSCVKIYLPNNDLVTRPMTGQDDIQEPTTIYQLCMEVLELHVGFSVAEGLSKLIPSAKKEEKV